MWSGCCIVVEKKRETFGWAIDECKRYNIVCGHNIPLKASKKRQRELIKQVTKLQDELNSVNIDVEFHSAIKDSAVKVYRSLKRNKENYK